MNATSLNARLPWSKLPSNVGDLNSRRERAIQGFFYSVARKARAGSTKYRNKVSPGGVKGDVDVVGVGGEVIVVAFVQRPLVYKGPHGDP